MSASELLEITVRAAALSRFGLDALSPGEPVANLRRRFVPLWLLHRYQLVAAAKAIGGVEFTYAIKGGGREAAGQFMDTHEMVAKLLYVLIVLHIAGALKHQFINRDNVLHRMIPMIPRRP